MDKQNPEKLIKRMNSVSWMNKTGFVLLKIFDKVFYLIFNAMALSLLWPIFTYVHFLSPRVVFFTKISIKIGSKHIKLFHIKYEE